MYIIKWSKGLIVSHFNIHFKASFSNLKKIMQLHYRFNFFFSFVCIFKRLYLFILITPLAVWCEHSYLTIWWNWTSSRMFIKICKLSWVGFCAGYPFVLVKRVFYRQTNHFGGKFQLWRSKYRLSNIVI